MWWETAEGASGLGGLKTSELPLYGIQRLSDFAVDAPICLVEGEKAADSLVARGVPALGTVCGASATPTSEVLNVLVHRDVVLWPDNDTVGQQHMDRIAAILHDLGSKTRTLRWRDAPPHGDAADFEASTSELLDFIGSAAIDTFQPNLPAERQSTEVGAVIPWEGFDDALLANAEYLERTAVIDKLCYSSAVSMITGGKHAGKSTLARWMAICVSKGYDFLRRSVNQGPVLYIASTDETMAARQELIRLGWSRDDHLRFLSASKLQIDDQQEFLIRLTAEITRMRAVLTIVDMLFDFIPIDDEMSYAGTRKAVGLIQKVASGSGSHIVAIHHAPKNANIGDAAVAALGSQGLAARVSPIILVRRFGPGVHSVSSTDVRDPRGQSIPDSRLVRNEDGSVELGGAFKNYMLAEVYSERVKELLEADPGTEMTAPEVSEALTITYEVARACLSSMCRNGLIQRSGSGKKGKPYRYSVSNDLGGAGSDYPNPTSIGTSGERGISQTESQSQIQRPFAYKDS